MSLVRRPFPSSATHVCLSNFQDSLSSDAALLRRAKVSAVGSMQAEDALRQHAGTPQYVLNQLIKQGIDAMPHPRLQLAMVQAFTEMQKGSSPGFQLLRGDTGR